MNSYLSEFIQLVCNSLSKEQARNGNQLLVLRALGANQCTPRLATWPLDDMEVRVVIGTMIDCNTEEVAPTKIYILTLVA